MPTCSAGPKWPRKSRASTTRFRRRTAIDYFGRQYGLPPVITGHQNYWLWGPHNYTGQCMVILGRTRQELESNYSSLTLAGETYHPYAIPFENHRQIWICRGPKYGTLQQAWYRTKNWI